VNLFSAFFSRIYKKKLRIFKKKKKDFVTQYEPSSPMQNPWGPWGSTKQQPLTSTDDAISQYGGRFVAKKKGKGKKNARSILD